MAHLSASARRRLPANTAIKLRRSSSVIADQRAISSSDRQHPAHSPVLASITQTLMHGVSMEPSKKPGDNTGKCRHAN
jgi:hypothetical protein